MIARTLTLASLFVVVSPLCAAAGEATYSADDVFNFLIRSANESAAMSKNVTRGICVGTEEECGTAEKKKPEVLNLKVNFELNSAVLTPEAKDDLLRYSIGLERALKDPRLSSSGAKLAIDGYTDASGSERYNLGLSKRRADAVVKFFGERGVDVSKLEAKGHGETNPAVEDPYDPVNRRVETYVVVQ